MATVLIRRVLEASAPSVPRWARKRSRTPQSTRWGSGHAAQILLL